MSRSFDRDESGLAAQVDPHGRMVLSQGRSGSSSESDADELEDRQAFGGDDGRAATEPLSELTHLIERAAAEKPTMADFLTRLAERGVQAIPSIQSSGRLNGMSYRFKGVIAKGSKLGRRFTAKGLQDRLGVDYQPIRDDQALKAALDNAGFQSIFTLLADRGERDGFEDDRHMRARDRASGLSRDQELTLTEIGKFRTVEVSDLIRYRYKGQSGQFDRDFRVLSSRGLAERRTVWSTKSKERFDVVVLTKRGRNHLAKRARSRGDAQAFHAGFVKPAEVRHDLGIYRMYQAEAAKIEKQGGTITRVTLDFELKKKLYSELNRPENGSESHRPDRKKEIADHHQIGVVDGRFVIPDLRIDYETADREPAKVDLELTTSDYKSSQVRSKHAVGLKIYAPDSALGSPALKDPELVSGLISF